MSSEESQHNTGLESFSGDADATYTLIRRIARTLAWYDVEVARCWCAEIQIGGAEVEPTEHVCGQAASPPLSDPPPSLH